MLNSVTLMGRLTRDPELKHTQSGTAVVSFTLAVDRDYKSADGTKETDFIDCIAWTEHSRIYIKVFFYGKYGGCNWKIANPRTGRTKERAQHAKRKSRLVDNIYFGDSMKKHLGRGPLKA